ncbi:PepSY domain-containing protein [Qipengyuania nanhaisediminis]|uniref:PepSY domain-containing protein n=1 Tax=Qipengyuania nanhaisediminis TaxID=604088 RepID=UPI0038B35AF1
MKGKFSLFGAMAGAALSASLFASPAGASALEQRAQEHSRSDQGEARREMRAGNQLSLRQIERRILPQMRGSEYLGPSYDSTARAYRLKFIRDGRVTYIDVDARTGRVIGRSN